LIGDRSIREEDFGRIQKNRDMEMTYWSDRIKKAQTDEKELKVGIVAANNHYAGFGAATANMFRVMNGMSPVEWGINKEINVNQETDLDDSHRNAGQLKTKQKTLLDYPTS
jgi:hypothetical protein